MNLSQQLSKIKNQEWAAGWSLLDSGPDAELLLPNGNETFRIRVPRVDLARVCNRFGEALPYSSHRSGSWGLREERGNKVLFLLKNQHDMREGCGFYIKAPALLSDERIAKFQVGLMVAVQDGALCTVYEVENRATGSCREGSDRGEYREAGEKLLAQILKADNLEPAAKPDGPGRFALQAPQVRR